MIFFYCFLEDWKMLSYSIAGDKTFTASDFLVSSLWTTTIKPDRDNKFAVLLRRSPFHCRRFSCFYYIDLNHHQQAPRSSAFERQWATSHRQSTTTVCLHPSFLWTMERKRKKRRAKNLKMKSSRTPRPTDYPQRRHSPKSNPLAPCFGPRGERRTTLMVNWARSSCQTRTWTSRCTRRVGTTWMKALTGDFTSQVPSFENLSV